MDQLDYKPNSHKSKEEQRNQEDQKKKIEKVVKGPVKVKKKGELSKLADIFISEDAKNVKSYVLMDVLVPAIKKAISDIVTDGIDMILYGTSGRGKRRSTAEKISYRSFYDRRDDDRRPSSDRPRTRYSYDEIVIPTRGEAEEVLTRMGEVIDTYGVISVADFYEMVGERGEYTDHKYGWNSIRNADVVRAMGGGYVIRLPKAMAID